MKKSSWVIGIISCLFLAGCSSSLKQLNDSHRNAEFEPRIIAERTWAVDRGQLGSARSVEILSIGGADADRGALDRMTGDFYATFEGNSLALMASLFGASRGERQQGDAEYLLTPQIMSVRSKAGLFAFSDAVFETEVRFLLTLRRDSREERVAEFVALGRSESTMGTLYSYHDNAHKRANDAINQAFLEAQRILAERLHNRQNL